KMDYKRVGEGSPPAYSDGLATAPPSEMENFQVQNQHLYPQVPVSQQGPPYLPVQPPQHAIMQAAPPPPMSVVHTQTTVLVDNPGQGTICPHCQARIRLRVEHHPTGKTYCLAAILCLFLCWPCVCAPCCCNCCYKTSQFCPNCNACLGSF
ncbi:hypothetical protein KR009_008210, partial [Drosophila setifemur]